jgi:gliding motility-associated lipoprotein GldD
MKYELLFILTIGILVSCGNPPTPKPDGHLRIDLPEKGYCLFDSAGFPYRFEYPIYAYIIPDTVSYGYEPFWINMTLPAKGTIHISYKKINKNLTELLEDTYNFVYRHVIKADAITETPFANKKQKVYGTIYEIGGNAASSVQFYATDSLHNFIRGALYFTATPDHDFLSPMISYYTIDIQHLIETLEWK